MPRNLFAIHSFRQTASPFSWGLAFLALFSVLLIVYRPSAMELATLVAVDIFVASPLLLLIDERLFMKWYPLTKLYFREVNFKEISALNEQQRADLLSSLMQFPRRRSLYAMGMSLLYKGTLGCITIVMFWKTDLPVIEQITRTVTALSFIYIFFGVIVFFESHELVSQVIKSLHERQDWRGIFARYEISRKSLRSAIVFENGGIMVMAAATLVLQYIVSQTYHSPSRVPLASQVLMTGVFGFAMLARIVYTSRKYHISGLLNLFERFQLAKPEDLRSSLPLHSSPVLARFEQTFNDLSERLTQSERELTAVIYEECEKYRLNTLGEMSAIVSHDLIAPLSVLQFCAETAANDPAKFQEPRYRDQLLANTKHALELVTTLRAYLKNPDKSSDTSTFADAHTHVLKILSFQSTPALIRAINLTGDPTDMHQPLAIPPAELIHVLFNIYANALQSLQASAVSKPRVDVSLNAATNRDSLQVKIADNGAGLTPERFEELTAFQFISAASPHRDGLGLRLCRRLVERHGGSLSVAAQSAKEAAMRGAAFNLSIKVAGKEAPSPLLNVASL